MEYMYYFSCLISHPSHDLIFFFTFKYGYGSIKWARTIQYLVWQEEFEDSKNIKDEDIEKKTKI